MKRPRILVVDDEEDLVKLMQHHLQREHYEVVTAFDGESALKAAKEKVPDLVILDLMLPGMDGLEVCRRLKSDPRTAQVPIIMATAKAEEADAVIGLAQGADDYIRKPLQLRELVARVGVRLRAAEERATSDERKVVRFGDLVIDAVKHEVSLKDKPLKLTMTEFRLLRHLATNPGRAFTRNDLLDSAVAPDAIVIDRNVDVHVATLRKKLGPYGRHILTIRGLGYKFREHPNAPD